MKKTLRILTLTLTLILALCALCACGEKEDRTTETENKITITVQIVDDKGETATFPIETNRVYLQDVLLDEKLVEGEDGPYGLYIKKANGILADYDVNGAYWKIYEGDTAAMTGANEIKLKDGGIYKLVYTK